jgi:hypothetical protein
LNEKVTAADERTKVLEEQSNKAVSDLNSLFDSFFSEKSEVKNKNGKTVANPIKAAKDEAATAKSDAATAKDEAATAKSEASTAKSDAATAKDEAATANKSINEVKNADETGYKTDQGKINGRVTALPALNKSSLKYLFGGILNALGILASNIKAVDDEVDERGDAQDAINDMLEKPFPLVASVSAPQGVVCGDSGTSLQFKLTNIGSEDVSFNSNSEFRFIIPIGGDSADLAINLSEVGTMTTPQSGSPSETGDTVVFKWNPSNEKKIASRTSETFTISNITPNATVGFVTIFIEYQGIKGYPSGKLSVAVSKVSKDIAQLVGGENIGIGTGTTNLVHKLQVNGNVNTTGKLKEDGHDLVPRGVIVMWSGDVVPDGWLLCNGSNGTPNLCDRFILGSSVKTSYSTGGTHYQILTKRQMPTHDHKQRHDDHTHKTNTWLWKRVSNWNDKAKVADYRRNWDSTTGAHWSGSPPRTETEGNDEAFDNRPKYYELAFIMKV